MGDAQRNLDYVFAIINSGVKGGITHDASAVVYFGRDQRNQRLYILDWEAVELGAASLEKWFFDVAVKLRHYRQIARITNLVGPIFVEPAGLGELLIAKFPGDTRAIDTAIVHRGKDLRALSAEPLINGGSVRMAKPAHERVSVLKGQRLNHLVSQLGGFRIGDKDAHKRPDDLLDGSPTVAFWDLRSRHMADYKHRVEASPFYKLPSSLTNPELIAAAMISGAHLKAPSSASTLASAWSIAFIGVTSRSYVP